MHVGHCVLGLGNSFMFQEVCKCHIFRFGDSCVCFSTICLRKKPLGLWAVSRGAAWAKGDIFDGQGGAPGLSQQQRRTTLWPAGDTALGPAGDMLYLGGAHVQQSGGMHPSWRKWLKSFTIPWRVAFLLKGTSWLTGVQITSQEGWGLAPGIQHAAVGMKTDFALQRILGLRPCCRFDPPQFLNAKVAL